MVCCSAYGCKNRSSGQTRVGAERPPTFHRFPKDPTLKGKWENAMRWEDWKSNEYSRVCSDHFTESDFDNSSPFRRFLKKDAVPSVFPGLPKHLQKPPESEAKPPRRVLNRNPSPVTPPIPAIPPKTELELTVDKLEKTQQQLFEARKKLRNVGRQQRRLLRRVDSLKAVVEELKEKNRVQSVRCEVMSKISQKSFSLLRREAQKQMNPKTGRSYDERVRKFASTLYSMSPKAYKFVRSTFRTCLPHPRSLAKPRSTEPGSGSKPPPEPVEANGSDLHIEDSYSLVFMEEGCPDVSIEANGCDELIEENRSNELIEENGSDESIGENRSDLQVVESCSVVLVEECLDLIVDEEHQAQPVFA